MVRLLVTGATGNVGLEVVKALKSSRDSSEVQTRVAVRSSSSKNAIFEGLDCVPLDFVNPATYAAALHDVTGVFLVRPPALGDVERHMFPFLDAAAKAGVQHIVFLSLVGVEQHTYTPHYKLEQHLKKSSMSWTFLRASFFMQNLSGIHRADIQERNGLYLPVGDGRTSFVDARDIGAVGAQVLANPGHENKAYDLTGSEALSYTEVAAILSRVLGRAIKYHKLSVFRFFIRELYYGRPFLFVLVMCFLYTGTKKGMSAFVTDEVQRILRRPPITFEQFATDHRQTWEA